MGGKGVLNLNEDVGGGGALHDFLVNFEDFNKFKGSIFDSFRFGGTHLAIKDKLL